MRVDNSTGISPVIILLFIYLIYTLIFYIKWYLRYYSDFKWINDEYADGILPDNWLLLTWL